MVSKSIEFQQTFGLPKSNQAVAVAQRKVDTERASTVGWGFPKQKATSQSRSYGSYQATKTYLTMAYVIIFNYLHLFVFDKIWNYSDVQKSFSFSYSNLIRIF